MHSRWFNIAVVVLWLSAMSWLTVVKVLPPLLLGEPPSYRNILEAREDDAAVGWSIAQGKRELGWAISTTVRHPGQLAEIHSRVHFDDLRINDMVHGWLGTLLQGIAPGIDEFTKLKLDAKNTFTVDALGHLLGFQSTVRFELPEVVMKTANLDPGDMVVRMSGTVDEAHLNVTVRLGNLEYTAPASLPRGVMLGDALSPQTLLPGLSLGQTWKVETYSPSVNLSYERPLGYKTERLQATVEDVHRIRWDGHDLQTWLVVLRSDSGFSFLGNRPPLGRMWVCRDDSVLESGTVVRQEVMVFDKPMIFERLPGHRIAELEKQAELLDHSGHTGHGQ
ncbi:MAG TPA: hypothetical protein VMY42_09375 [Thermoguttaceae bacterium]|nr:hypothetical protein [Thermoguttaceae bacterium]